MSRTLPNLWLVACLIGAPLVSGGVAAAQELPEGVEIAPELKLQPLPPAEQAEPANPDNPGAQQAQEPGAPEEGSIEELLADPDLNNNKQPTVKGKDVRVANPVAEFAGLDKITGRIISFDVYVNETVQFGALQVTPRICYSRPDAEEPKTDSFVEVDEITLDRKIRRIFTGWMFAESPGLNAVEHAVYDVWLKSCRQKSDVPPPETATTN